MNIVFFGPQGSGKGTQARLLAKKLGYFYFEAGEFLRELGRTTRPDIKERIDKGIFLSGEEMSGLVIGFLEEKNLKDKVIFDGFPRSMDQYNAFKPWMEEKGVSFGLVIVLNIDEAESVRRISARRQDPETGKIYNLITDPPGSDVDQTKLVQRVDDTPEAVQKRLDWHKNNTVPLIENLKEQGNVVEIDGNKPIDAIQSEIEKAVEGKMGTK